MEKVVNKEDVKIFVDDNKLNSCKLEFEGLMNCVNNNILDLSKCQDLAIKFDFTSITVILGRHRFH